MKIDINYVPTLTISAYRMVKFRGDKVAVALKFEEVIL